MDRIQPGLYIRLPVKWKDHPFLFNSFKIKDQEQIDIIKHIGIQHVYINLSQSDTKPLPPQDKSKEGEDSPNELDALQQKLWEEKQKRIETLNAYRRRVLKCEKEFERSLSQLRSVMSKIRNRPVDAINEASLMVEDIVDKFLADDSVTLHLMNGKAKLEDVYFHSLNVAVLSMMICRNKGYSAAQIKEVAFGALFHDMGKVKIPDNIIRKKTPLTDPERNYFQLHPEYGLQLIENLDSFPVTAKAIIEQHHEFYDGSGYPKGLKGEEIDVYAQIVSLANAYDNLCHPAIPSEQKIPYSALSHLYKNNQHLYSNENLSILVKFMGVYPPGTVVQLSNDLIGLVISVNSEQILYPSVLLYDPSVPRTQAPIVGLAEKELKIVSAILPNKLPDNIREYLNPRARISYFFDSDN